MESVCFDTSAWFEYFQGSPVGKKIAVKWVDANAFVLTPSIVLTEIEAKAFKEEKDASSQINFVLERSAVAAIDVKIARRAAREKARHKISTIDALVYATALENNLLLVTGDEHLIKLEKVVNVKTL